MLEYIRVYKQWSEAAGYYYCNVIRQSCSILGMEGVYQEGNTGGVGRINWWFKDKDLQASGESLPEKAWGIKGGDVISDEQYATLGKTQPSPTVESSDSTAEVASAV